MMQYHQTEVAIKYKEVALDLLHFSFPSATHDELEAAVDYSIDSRMKNNPVVLDNNYKHTKMDSTLIDVSNYILSRQPIITSFGVMFNKHGTVPNPIYKLLDDFIRDRKSAKKQMFKFPKGSELFAKYNLIQLLLKLDANAYYGASGKFSCIYYNLYCAASTTIQGRSCNSAAALLFESILDNNVPFGSFNELLHFVRNVVKEPRMFSDRDILDSDITMEECLYQLLDTTGFDWIPTKEEMLELSKILAQLSQQDINRLFYKNNLFNFIDNTKIHNLIVDMLVKLRLPFLDPNEPPEIISKEIELFSDLLKEFVYYDKQIIDRLEKMNSLVRSVSILQDTDSAIISMDGWYRYILNTVADVPMKIKDLYDPFEYLETGEDGTVCPMILPKMVKEYDFFNDEIIDIERASTQNIIPQDSLRFSIINILAYCIGNMVNDFMSKYAVNSNSQSNGACMLILKNEFLFKRLLLTTAKKNYASIQELQEGNMVPENESLDIKGMPAFIKSSMSAKTRKRLKEILYEDILKMDQVDQARIIKDIALVEKEIYLSIQQGNKEYFKPVKVKSMSSYEDPMRIQGIKASIVYNALHEPNTEALDLTGRNSVDVAKVNITKKNIDKIKDTHPDVYDNAMHLLDTDFKGGIDSIALPLNEPVPTWLIAFIDYTTIINDNVSLFPLESLGIYRGNKSNNYTNILSF